MKCELCHQRNAETVIFRKQGNAPREELYVCHACAERERAFGVERGIQVAAVDSGEGSAAPEASVEPHKLSIDLDALGVPPRELFGKLGEMFGRLSERLEEPDGAMCCPSCGATLEILRAQGTVGCPKCYEAFREPVLALLDETQGCTQYRGPELPGQRRVLQIKHLKKQLKDALAREAYVEAKALKEALARLDSPPDGTGEENRG